MSGASIRNFWSHLLTDLVEISLLKEIVIWLMLKFHGIPADLAMSRLENIRVVILASIKRYFLEKVD